MRWDVAMAKAAGPQWACGKVDGRQVARGLAEAAASGASALEQLELAGAPESAAPANMDVPIGVLEDAG